MTDALTIQGLEQESGLPDIETSERIRAALLEKISTETAAPKDWIYRAYFKETPYRQFDNAVSDLLSAGHIRIGNGVIFFVK